MERPIDQKQMGRLGQPPLPWFGAAEAADAATGLPSWRAVYFAVGGIFLLWVALLTALTWLYPAAP